MTEPTTSEAKEIAVEKALWCYIKDILKKKNRTTDRWIVLKILGLMASLWFVAMYLICG